MNKPRPNTWLSDKVVETKPNICSECGTTLDAASGINNDSQPMPGSISMCASCGNITAFSDDLTLRPLTDKEMVEIAGDERIVDISKAIAALRREKTQVKN